MICSSKAAVDADLGRLLFSVEPAAYYSLQPMKHDLHACGDKKLWER
jgi:hypothetical protein